MFEWIKEHWPLSADGDTDKERVSTFDASGGNELKLISIQLVGVAVILIASIFLMWVFNISGIPLLKFLNFGIAAIGWWGLWFFGLRPTNLIISGGLGGLYALLADKDKSQGIATGPVWLFKVLRVIVFSYSLVAVTLLTWSFQEAPMAFWLAFFCSLVLLLGVQVFRVKSSPWVPMLIGAYLVITPAIGLWQTFGPAYNGGAFDPCNGKSLYIVDPMTNDIVGKHKPTKCQKPYPYSSISGKAVVDMSAEQAIARSPKSTAGYAVQTVTKAVANPEWKSLSTLAIVGGLVVVGLLVFNKKARGAIGGNIVPVLIVGGLLAGGYYAYKNYQPRQIASACSATKRIATLNMPYTIPSGCEQAFDVSHLPIGFQYDGVGSAFVGRNIEEIVHYEFHNAKQFVLIPRTDVMEREGRKDIVIMFLPPAAQPTPAQARAVELQSRLVQ